MSNDDSNVTYTTSISSHGLLSHSTIKQEECDKLQQVNFVDNTSNFVDATSNFVDATSNFADATSKLQEVNFADDAAAADSFIGGSRSDISPTNDEISPSIIGDKTDVDKCQDEQQMGDIPWSKPEIVMIAEPAEPIIVNESDIPIPIAIVPPIVEEQLRTENTNKTDTSTPVKLEQPSKNDHIEQELKELNRSESTITQHQSTIQTDELPSKHTGNQEKPIETVSAEVMEIENNKILDCLTHDNIQKKEKDKITETVFSCHRCRKPKPQCYVECPECNKIICTYCLDIRYPYDSTLIADNLENTGTITTKSLPTPNDWTCPSCRCECDCSSCQIASGTGSIILSMHDISLFLKLQQQHVLNPPTPCGPLIELSDSQDMTYQVPNKKMKLKTSPNSTSPCTWPASPITFPTTSTHIVGTPLASVEDDRPVIPDSLRYLLDLRPSSQRDVPPEMAILAAMQPRVLGVTWRHIGWRARWRKEEMLFKLADHGGFLGARQTAIQWRIFMETQDDTKRPHSATSTPIVAKDIQPPLPNVIVAPYVDQTPIVMGNVMGESPERNHLLDEKTNITGDDTDVKMEKVEEIIQIKSS
eukprot:GHVL01017445.1.p1 GENE.GHVL01017445.1~~GHVL01017445.1.p1  ORF type:complete len:589 (-),score=131.07 GHVL01017445.1:2732-4498(-)